MNITLFFAFFASFNGDGSLIGFYIDFIKIELFFNIDFPPAALGCFGSFTSFIISLLSSPNPKLSLTYLLITNRLLPKMLCSLPSSESESFLMFYFCPTSADFLLFFITIPSIPFLGIISNFDFLAVWLLAIFSSY